MRSASTRVAIAPTFKGLNRGLRVDVAGRAIAGAQPSCRLQASYSCGAKNGDALFARAVLVASSIAFVVLRCSWEARVKWINMYNVACIGLVKVKPICRQLAQ